MKMWLLELFPCSCNIDSKEGFCLIGQVVWLYIAAMDVQNKHTLHMNSEAVHSISFVDEKGDHIKI